MLPELGLSYHDWRRRCAWTISGGTKGRGYGHELQGSLIAPGGKNPTYLSDLSK